MKCIQGGGEATGQTRSKKKRSAFLEMEEDTERATVRIILTKLPTVAEEVELVKEATGLAMAKYWHVMQPVSGRDDVDVSKSDDGFVITLTFKLRPDKTTTCALPRSVFGPRALNPYFTCPVPV